MLTRLLKRCLKDRKNKKNVTNVSVYYIQHKKMKRLKMYTNYKFLNITVTIILGKILVFAVCVVFLFILVHVFFLFFFFDFPSGWFVIIRATFTIDLIRVLRTVMHYGIVSGIEKRKVSWEIKRSIPSDKRFASE